MKLFQIVSIGVAIVSLLSFIGVAHAAIQFLSADTDLNTQNNAKIKLTMTFEQPVAQLQLAIFGAVSNVVGSSNSGPVNCVVETGGVNVINCRMNLTWDKRTLDLRFDTSDFVKSLDTKKLFSLDLSLNQHISQSSAIVKLPEGYALTNTSAVSAIYPPTDSILSDGRRIIVNWNLENITTDQSFKLQVLYEPVQEQSIMVFIFIIVLALMFGVLGFFLYRRVKKPKDVILSVLDDFERRVIETITNAGGELNQRKVVIETNLSKAKVSRVVKRLQERGLIEVKRLGRTNKLKLSHQKFEGN